MLSEAYLGLGSNLGKSARNLRDALALMRGFAVDIQASPLYRTAPQGFGSQPAFYNAACRLRTRLDPYELLARLIEVEAAIGRRRSFLNAPRAIDIDILFYNRMALNAPHLTLPHPRLGDRLFALMPLADIAPHLAHPISGLTIREMLARLPAQPGAIIRVEWRAAIAG